MTETAFQQQVIDLARLYQWMAYHTFDSRRSTAGFPDLVLVRAPEIIIAELKAEKGTLSPAQREWIAALGLVEEAIAQRTPEHLIRDRLFEVNVWRPSDFDAINRRLSRARPGIRHQVPPLATEATG
jgi:hypothetical protein